MTRAILFLATLSGVALVFAGAIWAVTRWKAHRMRQRDTLKTWVRMGGNQVITKFEKRKRKGA